MFTNGATASVGIIDSSENTISLGGYAAATIQILISEEQTLLFSQQASGTRATFAVSEQVINLSQAASAHVALFVQALQTLGYSQYADSTATFLTSANAPLQFSQLANIRPIQISELPLSRRPDVTIIPSGDGDSVNIVVDEPFDEDGRPRIGDVVLSKRSYSVV